MIFDNDRITIYSLVYSFDNEVRLDKELMVISLSEIIDIDKCTYTFSCNGFVKLFFKTMHVDIFKISFIYYPKMRITATVIFYGDIQSYSYMFVTRFLHYFVKNFIVCELTLL